MNTDQYIVKLKTTNVSDPIIAEKLGISVEEVNRRWNRVLAEVQSNVDNGYNGLCDYFSLLAQQYQLVGESLKVVGSALGNVATSEEILKCITSDPEETFKKLKSEFIILKSFSPPSPEELEKMMSNN